MGNTSRVYHACAIAGAVLLSGCASSVMGGFVGQPVQQAMVKYGTPSNAFDMGDGRRAFQWVMQSTYVTPTVATNTGNAFGYGNSVSWTQNTTITGGQPITSKCAYTLYGRWSETAKSWIVEGFEKPPLLCE